LTFRTGNIFAGDAIHRLFGKENLKKLTVVRNRVSTDLSEQLELNACIEETSFINPVFKRANWFDLFSPNQDGVYEIGDNQFEDIRATVKIGNTTRTASLESFKNFSMTFDLPESIYQMDGTTVKPDALKAESIKICKDLAEGIDFSGGDHL
jgi:hypothetical protein